MTTAAGMPELLAGKEIIVVCGPGGVGKTTIAASAGLLAARQMGGRVLVLTVDPARRLATALGLKDLGNDAVQIAPELVADAGDDARGELWVAQLDTRQSWNGLIERHAPDRATRDAILNNSLYENVIAKFAHSHDYIAMERLFELHSSGEYDLIIVDTPPSRNAIDFLEAPDRMAEFFGSRLLRWLTVPYRSRIFTAASKPFYSIADRVLGQEFLREIADFFLLFQTMYDGFVARATQVRRVLRSSRTSFVVVSTLESGSVNECEFFADALAERDLHLGGIVLNRILPAFFGNKRAATSARSLARSANETASELSDLGDSAVVASVLREVSDRFLDYGVAAARQNDLRGRFDASTVIASVPYSTDDIVDVVGLGSIADELKSR